MLYTLEQVIANRPPLITIPHDATMLDAMRLLVERRLGQLPVVDETGRLHGIISQQIILGIYHMTGGKVSLFDLSVADGMEPAQTLSPQDDLLSAVERLRHRGNYAVIVVQDEKPVGILTGKDMSVFFQSLFEGILLVERIERQFRLAFAAVFPDETSFNKALIAAFGADKDDPEKPQRGGRNMSLTDMAYFVRDDDNWPLFEPLFGNRDYFRVLTDRVRSIRNEIAHFQGHVDTLETDTLRRAAVWLETRLAGLTPAAMNDEELAKDIQTLASIVGGRKPLVCTQPHILLRDALGVMIENRFGQLPVLDEHGCLMGMVSQQSILRTYYHTDGVVDLLDLPVMHCSEPVTTLQLDDDLFKAANVLARSGEYAPVVVEGDKPVAMLTGKDMTHFFRSLFEGIILIERIETRLREYAEAAFPDPAALNQAAIRVFGPGPKNPEFSARNPNRFSFGDRMMFMCDGDVWPAYEQALDSRKVFMQLMDRVRRVRNALMHFRGNMSYSEQDALHKAYSWLAQRPMVGVAPPLPPLPENGQFRATANNPYIKVMGSKPRTLPPGADDSAED
ncbi:MAG: CBS domain-containing protein [Caldilineales bacterium]|nr:CBS domain-containing protein [Caldilineales bacterium]